MAASENSGRSCLVEAASHALPADSQSISRVGSTESLLDQTGRRRCWAVLAILYLIPATIWVLFGVLFMYFVYGVSDVHKRWATVLPNLGETTGRAACMGVHFVCGSIITLLGVWQVHPKSRTPRWLDWHRQGGRLYMISSVLAALGGLGFIMQQRILVGGLPMTMAFTLYGVSVLVTALKAWWAIRHGDVESHRRWALRTFSLGIASFLYRGYFLLAAGLRLIHESSETPHPDPDGTVPFYMQPFMQIDEWWFFMPNLLFVEWLLRASSRKPQRALLDVFLGAAGIMLLGIPVVVIAHTMSSSAH
eukprot:TRINITY_DN30435_c0_g1_i2.p1 TRINITY_DN30435_c0_g1~~TRINITY_DN30435_c0_g1_i2.p1  ORF type:complete len:306 (+),score=7.04 TRINITY_DN30435_c0_g1_i2:100-1017(+)